jgi:hypothetical protein
MAMYTIHGIVRRELARYRQEIVNQGPGVDAIVSEEVDNGDARGTGDILNGGHVVSRAFLAAGARRSNGVQSRCVSREIRWRLL